MFNLASNDADTSSFSHFLQAYYELRCASYAPVPTLPTRADLRSTSQHYARHDTVLIAALRYRLQYIDSNAVHNNLLRWESVVPSRLFDIPNRIGSPYKARETAVAAALTDSLQSGTARFYLPAALALGNTGVALQQVSIAFGNDWPEQVLRPGQSAQVWYDSPGHKTIRYQLLYADGSEFMTYSTLYVPKAACTTCRPQSDIVEPCHEDFFDASIPFQGIAARAQAGYYYSTTPQKDCNGTPLNVTKPLILLDGIDYEDNRIPSSLYSQYLSYKGIDGRNLNLGRELRQQGYDIVVLNHPNVYSSYVSGGMTYYRLQRRGGADYMERNAFALVKLIQDLNQQLANANSTEQIVVIGPSMGGQVARYALAYMESQGLPHNTRLFIAFDSPNNGATIPLSLQHCINRFANETPDEALLAGLGQLNSPAARELVQHHYSQGTWFLPHPDRTAFVNQLAAMGNYPSQVRRVAVVNGALDGTRQTDQNGQTVLDGQQAMYLQQRGVPFGDMKGDIVRLWFPVGLIGRLITTASARLYYGPGYGATARVNRTYTLSNGERTPQAVGPAGSCGLDGAPGGYRTFFNELAKDQNSGGLFQRRHVYSLRDKACFIPTLSGLGYTDRTPDNCSSTANRNLVCTNETAFDACYGPVGRNEDHIQLTPANVAFIRNEILKQTPPPVFQTTTATLCPGGSAQLSVQPECSRLDASGNPLFPTTYTWTSSAPGLQITSGQGTATITVQAQPGFGGTAMLSVTAQRAGYQVSAPAQHLVDVTTAALAVDSRQGPAVCEFDAVTLDAFQANVDPASLKWYTKPVTSSVYTHRMAFDGQSSVVINMAKFGTYGVYITGTNRCTNALMQSATRLFTVQRCEPPALTLSIYPNPAGEQTEVTVVEETETAARGQQQDGAAPAAFQLTLYNGQGRPVHSAASAAGRVQLKTDNLPAGLYQVQVRLGSQVLRRQLSIQH